MDAKAFYERECLLPYKNKEYQVALNNFRQYQSLPALSPLDRLRANANIASCLFKLDHAGAPPPDWAR